MLKLNAGVTLICALFLAATLHAQAPSGETPKGRRSSGADTQPSAQSSAGEQPKSQTQSGGSDQSSQPPSANVSPTGQAANEVVTTTVRGCVQAGGSRITLTDSAGNTFLLRGDTSALKNEQHKIVEVSGQQYPPDSRQSSVAIPSIDIQSMRQIADKCPVHIYERPQPQTGNAGGSQPNPATTPYSGPREGPQGERSGPPDAVINTPGAGGAPSPGTGDRNPTQETPPR